MRAHSQRRILWILNALLAVGLLGVAAWYLLRVRPAVADAAWLKPAWADQAVQAFKREKPADQSALKPPVSFKELEEVDRPEYRQGERRWWWTYSGPPPPPPPEAPKPEGPKAPVVSELERLGQVHMLLFDPLQDPGSGATASVLSWRFKSGKVVAFRPGDAIREAAEGPWSIRLVDVRPKGNSVYEIVYDVYEDPSGAPSSRGTLLFDGNAGLPDNLRDKVLLPGGLTVPGAPAMVGAAGTSEAAEAPEAAGAPPGAAPDVGVVEAPAASDAPPAEERASAPPRVEPVWESLNRGRIEFDERQYEYFRRQDADAIAKTVTTQVAREGGKVVGLQITGISADSPAMMFDIRPGDILVSIDGKPVSSRSEAVNIIQKMDPNVTRVTIVIDRNTRKITYVVDPRDPRVRRNARYLEEGRR